MNTQALFQLSYGVYLLTTALNGKKNGCIINTACQVTASPAQISVAVNKDNLTCDLIQRSGVFAVHTLTQDAHMEFIGRYGFRSGMQIDKFGGMDVTDDINQCPCLYDSAEVGAVISCTVRQRVDVGTHMMFIGEVNDAVVTGYGSVMTYAYYHEVKKGRTPPKASAYQAEQAPSAPDAGLSGTPRWRCKVCGYVHAADTPPEKCPVCGQPADVFERL